jgi:hypothetical protein
MQAPPPDGYAWIAWRHENATSAREDRDRPADRPGEAQRREAADDEDAQDFFRGVGDRRQGVGRQHRETGHAGQPFVMREMCGNRTAEEQPLER